MTRLIVLTAFLFGATITLKGQDTTFYDINNMVRPDKQRSFYYKVIKKHKKTFKITEYYTFNNLLKKEATLLHKHQDVLHGSYKEYYISSVLKTEGSYLKGLKQPGFRTYYYTGQLATEVAKESGELMLRKWNFDGRLVSSSEFLSSKVFTYVEEQPQFEEGLNAFYKVVGENIGYPEKATKNGVQGRVYVQFVVNPDGSLTDLEVLKGIGFGCDEEAIRVLKLTSKRWTPGKLKGKPVKTRMVIPVLFKLKATAD